MREGQPSLTAYAVAWARAVSEDSGDEAARRIDAKLLPRPLAWSARLAVRAGWATTLFRLLPPGLVDHVGLRTAAIDAALREGIRAGIRQVAILGAGLDARAFRLPELSDATVYEIDHPATQAYKRARAGALVPKARALVFVPVDFERDGHPLESALADAGHDLTAPTFWIWEGVVPYLSERAAESTLRTIAARSCFGSRLAVTYITSDLTILGTTGTSNLGLRLAGEPLRSFFTPTALAGALERVGLHVLSDTGPPEWAQAYARSRGRYLPIEERLAVAERRATRI